jgi:nucleoid DNA-binding protein
MSEEKTNTEEDLKSEVYSTRQLVTLMANKGYKRSDAKGAIVDFVECLKGALLEGKTVKFLNFGTFTSKVAEPREMINPLNKQKITTKARRQIRFKAASKMKEV